MSEATSDRGQHRSLVSSAGSLLVSGTASNVGYFVASLLLARWLGPGGRGSVAFATLSVLMLSRLARLGVPEAASVFAASKPESRRVLLGNQVAFAIALAVAIGGVFTASLELAGAHPASSGLTTFGLIAAGLALNALFETLSSYLIACGEVQVASWTGLVQPWGWAVGVVVAQVVGDLTATSAVIAWVAPFVPAVAVRYLAAVRVDGIALPVFAALKAALLFGFPAWVGGTSTFLNNRFDQVLMGFISSKRQLGFYAVAVNASEALIYLGTATAIALTPIVARSDPSEIVDRTLRAFRTVTLATAALTLVAVASGPFLIPLVFGDIYRASIVPFVVLAFGAVGWTASTILSGALLGAHAPKLASRGAIVAACITVVLDVTLIPPFAANGAAIATTGGFFAAAVATALAFTRRFQLSPRELLPTAADARLVAAFGRRALRRVF
jgi:O-antigen/teichoic acid export membrane protein